MNKTKRHYQKNYHPGANICDLQVTNGYLIGTNDPW